MINSYEITVYGMKDDTEMHMIQIALSDTGVIDAGDSEVGEYLRMGYASSVFVDPSSVGKAVEILNALGYETDEDELEVN